MTSQIARRKTDKVSTETFSVTVHHVQVDLAALLGQFDLSDEVVLVISTPSGRPKKVTIGGNFLAPSRFAEDLNREPWA